MLVVGGGASAFDLLELCFQHRARRVIWSYRGLRWFMPTRKPKHIAGSVRGFARMQASGMTLEQLNAAIGTDLRSRYEKFGITEILPTHDFDVRHDQVIPGRAGMLENYGLSSVTMPVSIAIDWRTVTLSDGQRVEADLLLWGTGYAVDLSYFASPQIAAIRTLDALGARCGCIFRSLDAANLYFPGVGLDGIGSAPWSYSLLCRSIMSHIRGTARLDNEVLAAGSTTLISSTIWPRATRRAFRSTPGARLSRPCAEHSQTTSRIRSLDRVTALRVARVLHSRTGELGAAVSLKHCSVGIVFTLGEKE